jgi:hypothetical protein
MRKLRPTLAIALALAVAVLPPLWAEVWNDPAGVSVTDTSQTINFPHAMSSVLVLNDDATNEIYIRLFWCGETSAAATTDSIEIKATKSRTYTFDKRTEALPGSITPSGAGYCAISLVCAATETATARIEGK